MEKPLVNKKEQLQKFPGKGGWTFVAIPEVLQDKSTTAHFYLLFQPINGIMFSEPSSKTTIGSRMVLPL